MTAGASLRQVAVELSKSSQPVAQAKVKGDAVAVDSCGRIIFPVSSQVGSNAQPGSNSVIGK